MCPSWALALQPPPPKFHDNAFCTKNSVVSTAPEGGWRPPIDPKTDGLERLAKRAEDRARRGPAAARGAGGVDDAGADRRGPLRPAAAALSGAQRRPDAAAVPAGRVGHDAWGHTGRDAGPADRRLGQEPGRLHGRCRQLDDPGHGPAAVAVLRPGRDAPAALVGPGAAGLAARLPRGLRLSQCPDRAPAAHLMVDVRRRRRVHGRQCRPVRHRHHRLHAHGGGPLVQFAGLRTGQGGRPLPRNPAGRLGRFCAHVAGRTSRPPLARSIPAPCPPPAPPPSSC